MGNTDFIFSLDEHRNQIPDNHPSLYEKIEILNYNQIGASYREKRRPADA